jgi:hypothetical protein
VCGLSKINGYSHVAQVRRMSMASVGVKAQKKD